MLARRPCGEEHRQIAEWPERTACLEKVNFCFDLSWPNIFCCFIKQPCRQLPKQRKNDAGVSSGAHKHLQNPRGYLEPFPSRGEEKSHQRSLVIFSPSAFRC